MDRNVFLKSPDAAGLLTDAEGLAAARTWAAAGFTAVTGLLTFFGLKEGVLDRALRSDPTAALLVFVLLGLGVLCGLLARALSTTVQLRATWLLVAVGGLGAVSAWLFPDVAQRPGLTLLTALLVVALVVLAVLLRDVGVVLPAAVIAVGVASTSLGMYGTAKAGVLSKLTTDTPRVAATFERVEGADVLSVSVKVARKEYERVRLVATAFGPADETIGRRIGEADLAPDAAGDVDRTVVFPVVRSAWARVEVGYCVLRQDQTFCGSPAPVVVLSGSPESGRPQVGARIARAENAVTAHVDARSVPRGVTVAVRLLRAGELVSEARLAPGADGVATLVRKLTGVRSPAEVTVEYAVCADACGAFTTIARAVA